MYGSGGIVIAVEPKGVFKECVVVGTPKPGTVMELVRTQTSPPANGVWQYEPAGTTGGSQGMAADGDRVSIALLLEDNLQGKTYDDAYVTLTRGFLYFPLPGEEVNVLLENQSGTADDFRVGDKLIVDDGTGKLLIAAGSPESEPFQILEAVTDMTADTLAWAIATGQ